MKKQNDRVIFSVFVALILVMVTIVPAGAKTSIVGAHATKPATYRVNTTDDITDGTCNKTHCSLREAINDANAHPGSDGIEFKISGGPPFTIQPLTALPEITGPVTIDGTSQPGFFVTPLVELDGSNAGEEASGLVISAGGSTVRGLVINRFSGGGIVLKTNGGNTIQGNFIGTDATGKVALGNSGLGVFVLGGASGNLIGGSQSNAGNLISGNAGGGVALVDVGTEGNQVQGNLIGTDLTGTSPLGNLNGIIIWGGATDNEIGGTEDGTRNVISGNNDIGVLIGGSGTNGNTVHGNYVGTDSSGTVAVANSGVGVVITGSVTGNLIGGTDPGAGNVISGNNSWGVIIFGDGITGNFVQGNFIGTDASGLTPLGNMYNGIGIGVNAANNLIGGTQPGAGNLISGNKGSGVVIIDPGTTGNTVQGNFIGTDVTGTTVTIPAGPDPGDFEVIVDEACPTYPAGTDIEGWVSESDDPLAPWSGISVLFKGTNECGLETLGEASLIYRYRLDFPVETQLTSIVVTGGSFNGPDNVLRVLDADWNVLATTATFESPYLMLKGVSGSVFYVEEYDASSEYRFRQSIVVNGPVPLGNAGEGVVLAAGASNNLIGGIDPGARNLISGNNGNGVSIFDPDTTGNIVQGNYIGTDVTGMVALGNLARGILVEGGPTGNLIGGTQVHAGNLISGNELAGIGLFSEGTEGNQIQGNFIGTDITGMNPLGNGISGGFPGIRIGEGAANNLVGGTEPGAGNTIAFNGGGGIALNDDAGSGNSLLSNSVFANEGLGIDLSSDGVTPNDPLDADSGANDLQNFPAITGVTPKGKSVMIHGSLDSTPSTTFRLEFFSNDACDLSGFGEGQAFLGFALVTTNPAGFANFNVPVSLPDGAFVTATATNSGGSTSEFSACMAR